MDRTTNLNMSLWTVRKCDVTKILHFHPTLLNVFYLMLINKVAFMFFCQLFQCQLLYENVLTLSMYMVPILWTKRWEFQVLQKSLNMPNVPNVQRSAWCVRKPVDVRRHSLLEVWTLKSFNLLPVSYFS